MKPVRALVPFCVLLALLGPGWARAADGGDIGQNRKALAEARSAADDARRRGEKLEADAAAAAAAADRTGST